MAFSGQAVFTIEHYTERFLLRNEELTDLFPMHPFSTPLQFSDDFSG